MPKAEARRRRAEGATLAKLARSYDISRARFRDCHDEAPKGRQAPPDFH